MSHQICSDCTPKPLLLHSRWPHLTPNHSMCHRSNHLTTQFATQRPALNIFLKLITSKTLDGEETATLTPKQVQSLTHSLKIN